MRVITLNLNGIRSAAEKGYFYWQRRQAADVICLQEVRALPEQIPDAARSTRRYHAVFQPAAKKGYSGVAIYARKRPDRVVSALGWPGWDEEGRYLRADFGPLSVVSLYIPSGSSGEERQAAKYRFLDRLYGHLSELQKERRSFILCGDWNIAHRNIDLENWRSNQKNSGFLPEERAWLDRVFDELGWVDAFRVVNQAPRQYTWWSNRGRAYEKDVGWRLDYQIVSPDLRAKVKAASIYRRRRFSDHAPLVMDYDLEPLAPE